MVGKLIKHEFRATARVMLMVYALLAAAALLLNLSIFLEDTTDNMDLVAVFNFVSILSGIGMAVAVVITAVVMIGRFYRNLLKDQGYLMHTLPVSVHGHIWSKLLVSLVWFAATFAVLWLLVWVTERIHWGPESEDVFSMYFLDLQEDVLAIPGADAQPGGVFAVLLAGAVYILLSCMTLCLRFYAAMALGHMFSKKQILLSIVFFIAIGIVLGILESYMNNNISFLVNLPWFVATYVKTLDGLLMKIGAMLLLRAVQAALLYAAAFLPLRYRLNLT